jgi:putative endonuclease
VHTSQLRGKQGEATARLYLEKLGMRHVASNWRCKAGEVDLIMQQGEVLVFVEVRLRAKTTYGLGLDTVAYNKQRKLLKTARWYQQQEHYWGPIRFDVVAITLNPGIPPAIEHVSDAFGS